MNLFLLYKLKLISTGFFLMMISLANVHVPHSMRMLQKDISKAEVGRDTGLLKFLWSGLMVWQLDIWTVAWLNRCCNFNPEIGFIMFHDSLYKTWYPCQEIRSTPIKTILGSWLAEYLRWKGSSEVQPREEYDIYSNLNHLHL